MDVIQRIAIGDVLDFRDGARDGLPPEVLGFCVLAVHGPNNGLVTERAWIRASHARNEPFHRHVAQERVLVVQLAIGRRQLIERDGRPDAVPVNGPVSCLHVKVLNLRDIRPSVHRLRQFEDGKFAFSTADHINAVAEDHIR